MKKILTTSIGRLRLLAFLEGCSLLILVFVAVPLKYLAANPAAMNTLRIGVEQRWTFRATTGKVLLACIIPFGTFYIDRKILRHIRA
jgi:hypothetical protein